MNNLKADIKKGKFKNLYLFLGEENFLKKYYENILVNNLIPKEEQMMNLDNFDGKNSTNENIFDAFVTLPFFSQRRVIIVKDSELFHSGKKDETEQMTEYINHISETSILIFVETNVDKRNRLYKKINKEGRIVEFKTPTERELIFWVKNIVEKNKLKIENNVIVYLLRTVSQNMDSIYKEIEKLINYKKENSNITIEDINLICTKSLETKIFDLVKAVANKDPHTALDIYNNLITMKESPFVILTMITRQFRIILQAKKMKEIGASNLEITELLGVREFFVRESLTQSKNFKEEILIEALKECLDIDIDIKTGRKPAKLAIEILILKYAS